MKNAYYKIIIMMLLTLNGAAQNPKSGVYMTFDDYNNRKLAYEINCDKESHVIKLNEFLSESYITVKHKGEKVKLQKDSIFAILNCDGPLIRFQNKAHFYLSEKGTIWIFYKEASISQSKGFQVIKEYYFSLKGDGKLIELTANNVKLAFPDNHVLHDMIDLQFQNNDIYDYDTFHKMFKINHVINASYNSNVCPMHSDVTGKEGDKCPKCGMSLEKSRKAQ